MFPVTTHAKEEDTGKPMTGPPNMKVRKNFVGKVESYRGWSTYFEPGKYNAAKPGDVYADPKKFTLKTKHPEAEVKFRPAK
jgi:hypothetical protein